MLQYKGQGLTLEGNMAGETIANSKLSYNAMGNLQYVGVCKVGLIDSDTRHFLSELLYDGVGNLIREVFATNQRYTGATNITVDLTNPEALITLTAGDVNEIKKGDKLYIDTIANAGVWVTVERKESSNSVSIGITDSALLTAEVATVIGATDVKIELLNDSNKQFDKRRWDIRDLYIYA